MPTLRLYFSRLKSSDEIRGEIVRLVPQLYDELPITNGTSLLREVLEYFLKVPFKAEGKTGLQQLVDSGMLVRVEFSGFMDDGEGEQDWTLGRNLLLSQ